MNTYLVTGAAGFIGYHLSERLLQRGEQVVGVDNMNSYYEVSLKEARLARLAGRRNFRFVRADLSDRAAVEHLFSEVKPSVVINLAAQAGVRYSLTHPHAYVDSNLVGFLNILEGCRHHEVRHLVYASSSSVYGSNAKTPFSEQDLVDHPISLYAATKKANELMAHTYSHLYRLPTTGLRFFTVYGPWGRPDMAYFSFTRAIIDGRPIDVFNNGDMYRDFTYIDDIVEGVTRIIDKVPVGGSSWQGDASRKETNGAPYRIYNIGNNRPENLIRFIEVLEECLGRRAVKRLLPMQPGDVPTTAADVSALARDVGFAPSTRIEEGVKKFVEWYVAYYSVAMNS